MDQHARFTRWLEWLFKWEGTVYENDPDDPGGETRWGIDKRSHPAEDIRHLTRDRAAEIYWNEYWSKCKAHLMPAGVGEVVANIAVNAGHSRASRWLQAVLNVPQDGMIGPKTLELLQRTEAHYRSIAKGRLAKFLRGWLNRNNDLRSFIGQQPPP